APPGRLGSPARGTAVRAVGLLRVARTRRSMRPLPPAGPAAGLFVLEVVDVSREEPGPRPIRPSEPGPRTVVLIDASASVGARFAELKRRVVHGLEDLRPATPLNVLASPGGGGPPTALDEGMPPLRPQTSAAVSAFLDRVRPGGAGGGFDGVVPVLVRLRPATVYLCTDGGRLAAARATLLPAAAKGEFRLHLILFGNPDAAIRAAAEELARAGGGKCVDADPRARGTERVAATRPATGAATKPAGRVPPRP
ncbi:MAG: hypothetical protein JWO31_339, partial [Phycisphaerales bacterium]|nr:hypothetical protein [Phycisphaerales bacterium]